MVQRPGNRVNCIRVLSALSHIGIGDFSQRTLLKRIASNLDGSTANRPRVELCRTPRRGRSIAASVPPTAMQPPDPLIRCAICGKPISLEQSKVTEDGRAVHEECYVAKLKGQNLERGRRWNCTPVGVASHKFLDGIGRYCDVAESVRHRTHTCSEREYSSCARGRQNQTSGGNALY